VTENSENTFPALPVREGENVFIWFSTFQDSAAYENWIAALSQSERWRDEVSVELTRYVDRAPEYSSCHPPPDRNCAADLATRETGVIGTEPKS
jgi:hypothetical protein